MYHSQVPGVEERKAMLLPLAEVEVSDKEMADMFSANCDETKLVKRLAEGQIAGDIRTRMNANEDSPVYLTELGGIAQIGDLTWENFTVLIVECEGEEVEFETSGEANNFVAFLKWLDEK